MNARNEKPGPGLRSLPCKGKGDASERELSREMQLSSQNGLLTPARTERQVSKFTLPSSKKIKELSAIEDALVKGQKIKEKKNVWAGRSIGAKAISMENLSPIKPEKTLRILHVSKHIPEQDLHRLELYACKEVVRMLLLNSWRRKREETKYLRKTVDLQHGNGEKMRLQIGLMKNILEADNSKVRKAVVEINRMKDDLQNIKKVNEDLLNEKTTNDKITSEMKDRISELEIAWLNSRNDIYTARKEHESTLHLLAMEKEKLLNARMERKHLRSKFIAMEILAKQRLDEINISNMKLQDLDDANESKSLALQEMELTLEYEKSCRKDAEEKCEDLQSEIVLNNFEVSHLKIQLSELKEEIIKLHEQLEITKNKLNQWPYKSIVKIATFRYFSTLTSWLAHVPSCLGRMFPWTFFPTRTTKK